MRLQHVDLYNGLSSLLTAQAVDRCRDGKGRILTPGYLKVILDTVYNIFGSGYGSTILTDNSLLMYMNENGKHAEENFLALNKGKLTSTSNKRLWINNSPCPNCVKKLLSAYKSITTKPTIFIAHFYGGTSNVSKEKARRCLAKLVKNGFTLKAFDWANYKKKLTFKGCIQSVDTATKDAKFIAKMKEMKKIITTIYDYKNQGKTGCP